MEEFFLKLHSAPAVMEAIIEHCFQFYYELTERMLCRTRARSICSSWATISAHSGR